MKKDQLSEERAMGCVLSYPKNEFMKYSLTIHGFKPKNALKYTIQYICALIQLCMRKTILLSFLSFLSLVSFSQQEPLFSQFWNAKTYYNPAVTGMYYKHLSTTLGRWQNVGVDGSPITQLAGYAARIKKIHGGIGFTYMHEEIGFSEFNKAKLNYSYQIQTKKGGIFSFGLGAGINALKTDPTWVPPTSTIDPSLPTSTKGVGFTGDFGLVYSTKKANIALSCTQLTASRIGNYQEARHLVLMSDFIFGKEDGLQFKPQVFIMSDLIDVTFDLNAMVYWKQKIGAGVTFRNNEDLSFTVNWDILKKFRVGYAYDYALGVYQGISKGSHTGFFGLVLN